MRILWEVPTVADLPDYTPPVAQSSLLADADDNLWIRQGGLTRPLSGTLPPAIYDIVSRQGKLVDRVQLPPQMTVAGFGPGVVYLSVREGAGTVLAKYRIH